ncbi:hypothetical protein H4J42_15320 [Colwellia sp. BRX8-8]|nr:hypothetical protein [Colwellia sp. BRX8-8]
MWDNLKIAFERYGYIIRECLETLTEMINAKFFFFAIVAVGIGTMGIWVPVAFELNLNEPAYILKQVVVDKTLAISGQVKEVTFTLKDNTPLSLYIEYIGDLKEITFENFSIFMYVISILGVIAAENFIKHQKPNGKDSEALHSFSLFIWFVAFVLSFWALKEPKILSWQLICSFGLAVSLWLSISVKSDHFLDIKKTSKELNGTKSESKPNFNGGGLSD